MLKIVFRLFVFVLFSCCASSCNKDTDRELECTFEIQNKDLREAIAEYQCETGAWSLLRLSDPLDLGFDLPGGTKYDYKPRTVTFYFKPVK